MVIRFKIILFLFSLLLLIIIFFGNQQTQEKKPRESILRQEFANAIDFINKDLPDENRLRFLHWDLHKHSRRYTSLSFICGPFLIEYECSF